MNIRTLNEEHFQLGERPYKSAPERERSVNILKDNPHCATYCSGCRRIAKITISKSPFGSTPYISTKGKEVLPLAAECRACGSGWPIYLVNEETLHRKAPKRQEQNNNPFK